MLSSDLWNSLLFLCSISSFANWWAVGRALGSSSRHCHTSNRKGCVMSISCRSSLRRMCSGTIFPSKGNKTKQRKKLFTFNRHEHIGPTIRKITPVEKRPLIHGWLRLQFYILHFFKIKTADKLYDRQGKKLFKSLIPYSTVFFSGIRSPPPFRDQSLFITWGGGKDDLGLNKVKI